jgi:hypothetical protein
MFFKNNELDENKNSNNIHEIMKGANPKFSNEDWDFYIKNNELKDKSTIKKYSNGRYSLELYYYLPIKTWYRDSIHGLRGNKENFGNQKKINCFMVKLTNDNNLYLKLDDELRLITGEGLRELSKYFCIHNDSHPLERYGTHKGVSISERFQLENFFDIKRAETQLKNNYVKLNIKHDELLQKVLIQNILEELVLINIPHLLLPDRDHYYNFYNLPEENPDWLEKAKPHLIFPMCNKQKRLENDFVYNQ